MSADRHTATRRWRALTAARGRLHCPARMSDFEAARLTVRLGAMAANYRDIPAHGRPRRGGGVVKADAYGMGMAPVAPALAAAGCDTFFVARLEEGVALRRVVAGGAHLRAGWRAARCGAGADRPSPDAGAELPGRDRGLERGRARRAHDAGCGDACRYRHEPAGPAGRRACASWRRSRRSALAGL